MINLAIKRLLRRKFVSIVFISALICIFVIVPAGLQNIKIASLAVDNSIEKHGRGSYDILVRPNSSRTQIEKELGMVEENYIGDSKGGISIADWKDIQKDADIEIAAPVASIGYFTGKNFSVELPELKDSTEFTWEFFTSDGLKEYSLGPPKNLMYFKESKPGLVQYLVDMESPGSSAASASMEVMMPPTYYMVAAIDVESEQKMTGIDLSDLNKNFDKEELDHLKSLYGDIPIIKVIQRKDINIPISLKMDVSKHDLDFIEVQRKLGLSPDDEWILQAEMKKVQSVLEEVAKKEPLATQTYEFDLTPYLNPFNGTALRIDEKFQLTDPINPVIGYIYLMQYFTAEKLKYQSVGERLSVKMVEGGEPPSYKEIETRGNTLFETHDFPYFMNQIGSYSAKEAVHNKLTSSPLGIYSTNEVTTKEGKRILPTTVPGSFIAQPAGGLISVESAELIKGPKPIDAIRVRVANLTTYNQEAVEKIEKVATRLLQKGYEVDIVAGSSLKMVELDVEGIGLVQSPWTTLGVAQALVNNWDYMTLVTTVLFLSFAGIWLTTRLVFERNMLEQENELLTIIGWQDNKITFRNRLEQYILLFIAYLLSIPVIEIFSLEKSAYIISTIILIFGVLLIYLVLNRIPIREARTTHKRMTSTLYYWSIIYPIIIILIVSTVLLSIQLSSIASVFVSSRETFLGQFLVEETLMFQLFTIIATLLLSVVSLSESFQALLYARREEFSMYKIIGWTKKRIISHLLKEINKWSGATLLISMVISLLVQYFLGLELILSLFGSIISAFLLGFLVFFLVVTNRSLSLAIKDKDTHRRLSSKILFKYMGAIGVSLTILYVVSVNYMESEQAGDFTTETSMQTSNIKSEKESSLVPAEQLSATSGAKAKYKIDLKLDESDTFHIKAEVDVQNLSSESWNDVGFYFIPNAMTEENKPEDISDATNLQIIAISDREDITYELRNNELLLKLKEEVAPGETKKIMIEYSLQISEEGFRLRKDEGGYYLAQWYPMLGYYDGGWNIHDFNPEGESYHTDYGDYEVAFNLPEDYFIASSGIEGKVEAMSSGIINAEQVKDFYLALLKPDKWTSETTKSNDTSIRVFLPVNESNNMHKTLQVSSDSFRYFEEKLGDNPFKELDVIGNHKHMEYPNVVEVSSTMEHVIVHEIAHQWFYYLVQNDPFNEGWLDEGLANFVSSIYLTSKYGDPKVGYEHPLRMAERQSISKIANLSLDQFEEGEYSTTVYGRVPLLLRDFFEKNGGGEEALQFLSHYIEKYRFNNVSSKDFAEYFIEYFGDDHEEFITEWLEV